MKKYEKNSVLHPHVDIDEKKINIFKDTVYDATFLYLQYISSKINVKKVLIEEWTTKEDELKF